MYRIRDYTATDRHQVAGLLHRLWSHDTSQNEAYLAWRYEANPYLANSLAVAEHDGRIVAVRGGYGMRWRVGGATELIPCVGDTIVEKQHEGRRLVQKLSRHLFRHLRDAGARYVVNQSPGKLVEKISLRTGWKRVGYRKLTRYVNRQAESGDFQSLDAGAPGTDPATGLVLTVCQDPPEDLLALLTRRRSGPPVSHDVDAEYLRWRFRNPFSTYRWLRADGPNGPTGFLLIARNAVARMRNRFRILDLWGTHGAVQAALLRRALDHGDLPNLYIWWNRFPRQVAQILVDYDFKAAPDEMRNPTVLIRKLEQGNDYTVNSVNLLEIGNWDARMIHSDVP